MSESPPSPRATRLAAPGWLDARLVLGVLLVLVSVVAGARVLSSADRSELVWAATRDLAAGSALQEGDLEAVRVRLFESAGSYVRADGPAPTGYVLRQAVGAGELLARAGVARPGEDRDYRSVTVPVEVGHFPPGLRRGQQVDVWLTVEGGTAAGRAGTATGAAALDDAQLVLAGVPVLTGPEVGELTAAGSAVPVVLQVPPGEVGRLVAAVAQGRIDLVAVPRASEAAGGLAPAQAG